MTDNPSGPRLSLRWKRLIVGFGVTVTAAVVAVLLYGYGTEVGARRMQERLSTRAAFSAPTPSERDTEIRYITLLERVNQQLSLAWTPYGVTFTILAALLGVLSLVAIAIIWYQGKEYRERLDETLERGNEVLNAALANTQRQLETFLAAAKNEADDARAAFEEATVSFAKLEGDANAAKDEALRVLARRAEEADVKVQRLESAASADPNVTFRDFAEWLVSPSDRTKGRYIGQTFYTDLISRGGPNKARRKIDPYSSALVFNNNEYTVTCSNSSCKRDFDVEIPFSFSHALASGRHRVECPYCGTKQEVAVN